MKKMLILTLCLLMALPAFSLAEEAKILNLMTWEGYIDDSVIAQFEEETGIDVVYAPMQTNEDLMNRLTQNGGSDFDLVLISDYAIDILRKEGLLQKLDQTKLPGFANLDEHYLGQYYDDQSEYAIPYFAGSPLIVYDPAKVSIDITGYADLWDVSLADSLAMIDDARIILGITLKTMGKSFNETDPAVLNEAKEKLMPLYQNVRVFDYNALQTSLVSGDTSAGFLFSTQVFLALMERPDLTVVYPSEGLGFGIDALVMPVQAEHVNNAHLFLDFLMRPEVAAHNIMWQGSMVVNKAAAPHLSEEFLANTAVHVPGELLENAEFIEDIGETATLMQELYAAFKQQ